MNYRFLLLTMGLALTAPSPAHAQPADTHAMADEQFRKGREAFNKGDFKHALPLFRTSHGLEPGRGKLLNIALCEEQVGELKSALEHFQEVAPQFPDGDDRGPLARQHIADLELKVPRLRIDLAPGSPAGTQVTLDGAPLARSALSADLRVDPGNHTIRVTAPGFLERRYDRLLQEGKRELLSVEPGARLTPATPTPAPVAAPVPAPRPAPIPPTADPTSDSGRSLTPGIALGTLAGAGIVTGLVFVGLRQGQIAAAEKLRNDIGNEDKRACGTNPPKNTDLCQQLQDTNVKGDTFGTVSILAFAAGGLATAGTLTYILWPTSKPRVHAAPVASATHQGILVWGSF